MSDYPYPLPDAQEMKRVAVGLLTASVNARSLGNDQEAAAQFASDFMLMTGDLKPLDWISLSSMLANCGGALVQLVARTNDLENDEAMRLIAKTLNDLGTTDQDDTEEK